MIVHGAGLPSFVARFSVCFGPKQRTFSNVSDRKYAGNRSAAGSGGFAAVPFCFAISVAPV